MPRFESGRDESMKFTIEGDDGSPIDFECADTIASRWVANEILQGKTYPCLPFVDDVSVVFDVGANCGAATVYFARHYPGAEVHSFEPGSEPRAFLERNAAGYANAHVHAIGLHSIDQVVPLYKGKGDSILGSVIRRTVNLDESEPVELRAAGAWTAEHGIDRIDVLKVDVEMCEVEVLESLAHLLPTVKVLYVEYGSRQMRRDIERILDATHELYEGVMYLDQGECIFIRQDLADLDAANEHLKTLVRAQWADRAGRA
jgi:FkbM family methyltransferase